jgi:hypothetical protein
VEIRLVVVLKHRGLKHGVGDLAYSTQDAEEEEVRWVFEEYRVVEEAPSGLPPQLFLVCVAVVGVLGWVDHLAQRHGHGDDGRCSVEEFVQPWLRDAETYESVDHHASREVLGFHRLLDHRRLEKTLKLVASEEMESHPL